MRVAFDDQAMSTVWRSDRCSTKCKTESDSAPELCSQKTFHGDSRFCPDNTTVCQVQCHTVENLNNAEKPLFGMEKLQDYGIPTPGIVAKTSWERREETRTPASRSALNLFKEIPEYHDQRFNLALPVCPHVSQISSSLLQSC
jgi:hypothetical protein